VGGVISGYCATGSVKRATPPASTTRIDSTDAKIGRSMKNLENTAHPPLRPAVGADCRFVTQRVHIGPTARRAGPKDMKSRIASRTRPGRLRAALAPDAT